MVAKRCLWRPRLHGREEQHPGTPSAGAEQWPPFRRGASAWAGLYLPLPPMPQSLGSDVLEVTGYAAAICIASSPTSSLQPYFTVKP